MSFPTRSLFRLSLILACTFPAVINLQALQQTRKVSVDALLYDLKHPDSERRRQAAYHLGQNKVVQGVPGLIELTGDPDWTIRLEALQALVKINDQRAVPAYTSLTQDGQRQIRSVAVDGILKAYLGDSSGSGFLEGVQKVAEVVNPFSDDYDPTVVESYVEVSPDATAAVAALLRSDDTAERRQAANVLGTLRAYSELPALQAQVASESDSGAKVELIRAIFKIGDPTAAEDLIPLIRDDDKKVHDEAIFAVGRLRVQKAVEPLREIYLSDVEERKKAYGLIPVSGKDDLQRNAYQALADIGDTSCLDLFKEGIAHPTDFYRRYAAEGVGRVGDQSIVTELARAQLAEKSGSVSLAQSFGLYRLGRTEHLDTLVESATGRQGQHYLLEFEAKEVARLYPYLNESKPGVTAQLLNVIGLRGDRSALAVAEQWSSKQNADIASAANEAVRRLRGRFGGN